MSNMVIRKTLFRKSLFTDYCLLITLPLLLLMPVSMVFAAERPPRTLTVSPFAEYFQWKESGLYVKESGMIYGVGVSGGFELLERTSLNAGLDLFAGEVNYDGTRFDSRPFRSKTLYLGLKAETDVSANLLQPGSIRLEPFLGGGCRWWKRRLDNTDEKLYGYDENWFSAYGYTGLRGAWQCTTNWSFSAEAAVILPVYNYETVYLKVSQDSSHLSLNPGRRVTPTVNVGAGWKDYRMVIYYERLEFGESDVDESGLYQPESKADIVGVKLGVAL
jgi:hypothetical protein